MYKSKFTKAIVFVLLIAGVLQAGIMAYSAVANQLSRRYMEEAPDAKSQSVAASDNTVQEVEIPKKEIDISNIILKKEVEEKIISLDAANAARNIKNYKTLLVALDVPESFQAGIEELYNKDYKVENVLIAYEYLYHNYGNISELEGLVKQKESGKAWKNIFKEYKKNKTEFKPRDFEPEKLDELFNKPAISTDDIVIADRVSQQTGQEFDELITMRSQGELWKNINGRLGILNTSGELPRAAIKSTQVKSNMKSTGLSEDKVLEALALAHKLDEDGKAVVDKVKAGSMEEDIIAESLETKYQ